SAGVEFPPREENSVPFFTPPQTQPIVHSAVEFDDAAIQASLQSDASDL
ncbi:ADP-ribosylation factor-binding protein GGA3-like, partial [Trifolium medium]|nr:ADP-ribosylation factor-binding protein GGA3-like [Trifolium medium]